MEPDNQEGEGKKPKRTRRVARFTVNQTKDGYSVRFKNKLFRFKKGFPLKDVEKVLKQSLRKKPKPRARKYRSEFNKQDIDRTTRVNPNVHILPYPRGYKPMETYNSQLQSREEQVKRINDYLMLPPGMRYPATHETPSEPQVETVKHDLRKQIEAAKKIEKETKDEEEQLDKIIEIVSPAKPKPPKATPKATPDVGIRIAEVRAAIDKVKEQKKAIMSSPMTKSNADMMAALRLEGNNLDEKLQRLYEEKRNTGERALPRAEVTGTGMNSKGMSNFEIDKVMDKYPDYLGTISHNEIKSRILPHVQEKSRGGFIINTDPNYKRGEHWQAIFYDARDHGSSSIEFFDSYGDDIDPKLLRDIKLLADKLNANSYLKFKHNTIKYQGDSSNCGPFAMRFLVDRFRGKPFKEATGYDQQGEKNIEKFKFQYIPSFSDEKIGGNILTGTYLNYYPRSMSRYLKPPIGDEPILSLRVGRVPLSRVTSTVLNLVTLGGWERAKQKLGYDNVFHLYLVINDKYRLERNHVTTMYSYSKPSDEQSIIIPLPQEITVSELLNKTAAQVGPELQRYSGSSNNCQDFVIQVLSSNNLLSESARTFIKQDIESIYEHLPFYSKWVSNLVTDSAHKIEKTKEDVTSLVP
jgi:hypothetical protein